MFIILLLVSIILKEILELGGGNLNFMNQITFEVDLSSGFELPIIMQLSRLCECELVVFFYLCAMLRV